MDRDRDRGGNWHHERGGGDWGGGTRPNDRGGGTRPNDRGGGARPNEAHMGPLRLPGGQGTLTARDRDDIWERYRVSASVRWRAQWAERCLSLSGDAGSLNAAKEMAMERIAQHGTEGGRASEPTAGPELQALQTQVHQLDQYVRNHHSLLQYLTQQATRAEQTAGQAVAAAQAYRQAGQDSLERISQRNTEAHEEFKAGIEERVQQIVRQVLEDRKKKRRKKRRTKRSESAEDEKEAEREKQDEQKQDGEGSPLHDTSFAKAERMSSTSPAGRDASLHVADFFVVHIGGRASRHIYILYN